MLSVIYHRLLDFLASISALLIFLIMVGISVNVLSRYFLGGSIIWMFEVAEYALLYIPCLGMAWLAREHGHIAITTFVEKLQPVHHSYAAWTTTLASAAVCAVIAYWGVFVLVDRIARQSVAVQTIVVPEYLIYWVIPFGFGLTAIEFLRQTARSPRSMKTESSESGERL